MQSQIRQNAEELSTYLSDITKWEAMMKSNAGKMNKHKKLVPTRTNNDESSVQKENTSDIREYGTVKTSFLETLPDSLKHPNMSEYSKNDEDSLKNMVGHTTSAILAKSIENKGMHTEISVPRARGSAPLTDCETRERELGNEAFKAGDYPTAVRAYTRCLGLKAQNVTAFANRAAVYLKMKEFTRAETDCSCALTIDPRHFKCLLRRACARNALGKHRAAYRDLITATEIDPNNSECAFEMRKTRELIRSAAYRAPAVPVTLTWNESDCAVGVDTEGAAIMPLLQGPHVLEICHGPNLNPLSLLSSKLM